MSCSNVGGRKNRNIRDHLFTLYAVINDVINGNGASIDAHLYDVIKCFDEMWYQETFNDLWNVQVQDDKFALLSKLDGHCKIVVKTPCGVTDMFEMQKIILQGSVFGPIKCSVQMDTLGKDALQTGKGIYKYKDAVDIPSLAMIDDVLGISTCGDASIELNAMINAKMESKKLRLSADKCCKIHVCKKILMCTQILKVHDENMKNKSQATYLGDVISEDGSLDGTIAQRGQKSEGIITQISSILSSVYLGSFHFDIAMVLRDAQFVNSIMTNSEIWHNVKLHHVQSLEKYDLSLLRKIMNAHSKTASEAFFFELGRLPLRFILSKRRLMYLWHVLHRDTEEIIWKIYEAQKIKSSKGDWFELLKNERENNCILQTDEEIASMSKERFRRIVDEKVGIGAVKYLNNLAEPHSKSDLIVTDTFEKKLYFSDRRFSKEDVQLLFALRTRMIDCKTNFRMQFNNDLSCRICKIDDSEENEEHILVCPILNDTQTADVQFTDVFGEVDAQFNVVQIYKKVLRRREAYIDFDQRSPSP